MSEHINAKLIKHLQNVWIYLVGIFVIGIVFQSNLFMCCDAAWLIHAARELLAGGTYFNNFFEVNPPMSIYIYLPVIFIAQLTHLSLLISFYIYIFSFAIGSFIFCNSLINQILPQSPWIMRNGIKIALALSYVILPIKAFGQREHIMIMLIMPYIFALQLNIDGIKITTWQKILIGLMAGIGFCIKPFFFFVFACYEIYLAFRTRSWVQLLRLETLIILLLTILYLISIWTITPDYISKVLPIVSPIYYYLISSSFSTLVSQTVLFFWLFNMIGYIFIRKISTQKTLLDLFAIASNGFLIVYFIQRITWYYHIYPMLVFSGLLSMLLFAEVWTNKHFSSNKILCKKNLVFCGIFGLVFCFWQLVISNNIILIRNEKASEINSLITLINEKASNANIYFIGNFVLFPSTLEYYTSARAVSRFPCFWILLADAKFSRQPHNAAQILEMQKTRDFVIDTSVAELEKYQPTLVLIQSVNDSENLQYHLDYLHTFSLNPQFRALWKNYRFIGTLAGEDMYLRS